MSNPYPDLGPLFAASTAGELHLRVESALRCAEACDTYIAGLDQVLGSIKDSGEPGGFGTLGSGDALGAKFSELLIGGGETLSLVEVLTQHIEIAHRLKAIFLKATADYAQTETDNTQLIAQAGGG